MITDAFPKTPGQWVAATIMSIAMIMSGVGGGAIFGPRVDAVRIESRIAVIESSIITHGDRLLIVEDVLSDRGTILARIDATVAGNNDRLARLEAKIDQLYKNVQTNGD